MLFLPFEQYSRQVFLLPCGLSSSQVVSLLLAAAVRPCERYPHLVVLLLHLSAFMFCMSFTAVPKCCCCERYPHCSPHFGKPTTHGPNAAQQGCKTSFLPFEWYPCRLFLLPCSYLVVVHLDETEILLPSSLGQRYPRFSPVPELITSMCWCERYPHTSVLAYVRCKALEVRRGKLPEVQFRGFAVATGGSSRRRKW